MATATKTRPTAGKAAKKKPPATRGLYTPPPVPERPSVSDLAGGFNAGGTRERRTAAIACAAQLVQTAWDVIRNDRFISSAIYHSYELAPDAFHERSRDMRVVEEVQTLLRMAWQTLNKGGFSGASFDTFDTDGQVVRMTATVLDRMAAATTHFDEKDNAELFPHVAEDRKAKRDAKRKTAVAKTRLDFAALPPRVECGC